MLNRAQNRDDLVPGAQRPEIGDIFHEMGIGIREMGNGLREMGIGMQEIGIGLRQDRLPAAPQGESASRPHQPCRCVSFFRSPRIKHPSYRYH